MAASEAGCGRGGSSTNPAPATVPQGESLLSVPQSSGDGECSATASCSDMDLDTDTELADIWEATPTNPSCETAAASCSNRSDGVVDESDDVSKSAPAVVGVTSDGVSCEEVEGGGMMGEGMEVKGDCSEGVEGEGVMCEEVKGAGMTGEGVEVTGVTCEGEGEGESVMVCEEVEQVEVEVESEDVRGVEVESEAVEGEGEGVVDAPITAAEDRSSCQPDLSCLPNKDKVTTSGVTVPFPELHTTPHETVTSPNTGTRPPEPVAAAVGGAGCAEGEEMEAGREGTSGRSEQRFYFESDALVLKNNPE